jgi:uncharacterized membrane protein YkoI
MRTILDRRTLVIALALMFAGPGIAHADDREDDDDDDHDRARRALEEGRVRPLAEILARVRDQLGGEVVGVELDRQDGRYVYEFKVITSAGRLREVYVDALTAELLKSEDD